MSPFSTWMLSQEARALLSRLARVKPFALIESMVPAAALLPAAQVAIERHLAAGRRDLERAVNGFVVWLHGPGRAASEAAAQRRFTLLRLRFNAALTQFDLFSDVITQRSETQTGVWLSGLDQVARDALALPGRYYASPPVVCYLDRGAGAAIRRARTRLPGGGDNPVAVIRMPRERMVGSGIASSLVHEVGHQAASLLDLVVSLRPVLQAMQAVDGPERMAWQLWERWISEIVADFWAVARVGVASTLGLIAVVSLPRAFVFRVDGEDPHPSPWIRVILSCAMGRALFPHPQWDRIADLWQRFYPLAGLDAGRAAIFARLQATMNALVGLIAQHRPRALRGATLAEALTVRDRQPARLSELFRQWELEPVAMYRTPPSLVFAVIGQARMDQRISPEDESQLLGQLLTHWALAGSLQVTARCAVSGEPAFRSLPSSRR